MTEAMNSCTGGSFKGERSREGNIKPHFTLFRGALCSNVSIKRDRISTLERWPERDSGKWPLSVSRSRVLFCFPLVCEASCILLPFTIHSVCDLPLRVHAHPLVIDHNECVLLIGGESE